MEAGRVIEGFEFLPSISLGWYYWNNRRHYYLSAAWLFWYITTLKKFEWNE